MFVIKQIIGGLIMAKGVIYVEETLVKNLVKIGKMESTAARMIIRAIKDKRPDMPA